MPSLTLKNIPDDLYRGLKASAADNGRSISAQVIGIIAEHVSERRRRAAMRESAERLRRLRAALPETDDAVALIREDRQSR